MDFSQLQKSADSPEPAYLLVTDQDYLKKKVFELARQQVGEGARAFDWAVFDLDKDSVHELVGVARTLPWMSSRRWIYVKQAEKGEAVLAAYLQSPSARSVLILEVPRAPKSWGPLPVVEMRESADPSTWIQSRVRAEGFQIEPGAVDALLELVGDDYLRLEMELEKQLLRHHDSRRISRETVLEMAFEAREHEIFELIDAIAARQAARALHILQRLFESGTAAIPIVSLLYSNFKRLLVAREWLEEKRPFFPVVKQLNIWSYKNRERDVRALSPELLRRVLLRLRETDRLLKSGSSEQRNRFHLERLVVDTCRIRPL